MDNQKELPGQRELPAQQQPMLAPYLVSASPSTVPEEEGDDLAALARFIKVVWKRKLLVLLGGVLGAIVGLYQTLKAVPIYRSYTVLEVENALQPFKTLVEDGSNSTTTHAEILKSRPVRQKTAEKVTAAEPALTQRVDPPFARLRHLLRMKDPLDSISWKQGVSMAAGSLAVTPGKENRLLTLSADSANPQAAADFLNGLIGDYLVELDKRRGENYEKTSNTLGKAQTDLKEKLDQSEDAVASLAKSAGLVSLPSGTQSLAEKDFQTLSGDLASARSARVTIETKYQASVAAKTGEPLPAVLDAGPMGGYQGRMMELQRQLQELNILYTPDHYKIKNVQAQMEDLRILMDKERQNMKARLEIELKAAKDREDKLKAEYEELARVLADKEQALSRYNRMKQEAEMNKKLYEQTLSQGKEASAAAAIGTTGARVVDPARPSGFSISPDTQMNMIVGVLFGLSFGAFGAILLARTDASIKTPGVLEALMNIRELGAIPSARRDPAVGFLSRRVPVAIPGTVGESPGALSRLRGERSDPMECLETVTFSRRRSLLSEAFRAVMTSILFSTQKEPNRVLLVTSPATQEGKSTVIANLAIALAEIGQRVLLIDGDLRLPRLHSIFALPNDFGLSGILNERLPVAQYDLDTVVAKTFVPDLYVLTAGEAGTSLARLLHSGRMKEIVERFRGEYDTILIDSAPVLTVPDARVLARVADAVILVFRANKTTKESAIAVAKCLEEDGTKVLGTVLNDWNPRMTGYGYGRGYGAYSQYHNSDAG